MRLGGTRAVEFRETETGRLIWLWSHERHAPHCVAFAPDGKAVLIAGWNELRTPPRTENAILSLNAATGREQWQADLGNHPPEKIAVSPDGKLLAVICYGDSSMGSILEKHLRVLEVATGKEVHRLFPPSQADSGRQRYFSALAFSNDSKTLLTSGGEASLILWDLATGTELHRIGDRLTGSSYLTFSPDGKTVGVAGAVGVVRMLDVKTGQDRLPRVGHSHSVLGTAVSPDGRSVATLGGPSTFVLWDATSGRVQRQIESEVGYQLAGDACTGFSWKGTDRTIHVWDLATGRERNCLVADYGDKQPHFKAVTPDGKLLAVGDYGGDTVHVVDVTSGKKLVTLKDPGLQARQAHFTGDGKTLVLCSSNQTAQVWDVARGRKLRQLGPMGPGPRPGGIMQSRLAGVAYASAMTPDGRWLAYGQFDGTLVLFDVATGKEVRRFDQLRSGAGTFTLSSDGRLLAWGGWEDKVIHVVELASGRGRHQFAGHRGDVYALSFSADGKTLVSGSEDTTALVWDLTGRLSAKDGWDRPLTPAELDACWTGLADEDAARAYRSLCRLTADATRAVPFLMQGLRSIPPDEGRLRAVRAVEALERIGTPAAREALEALGREDPEAQAAGDRLARRTVVRP